MAGSWISKPQPFPAGRLFGRRSCKARFKWFQCAYCAKIHREALEKAFL
jgi:hypothetical protein